jgi:predicted amidophosphoribosyltransferase
VLDLLLPRRCVVCAAGGTQLCADCRAGLPPLSPPLCALCGAPTAWPVSRCRECAGRRLAFATARAAVAYDADVRRLVRGWKEHGLRRLAAELAGVVADRLPRPEAELVTFVPADRRRRLERGYHPAEQLALALASAWGLPCEALLSRVGRTTRQRGLSRAERARNLRHAFLARRVERPVVLVDDVYTTGATAHAAAAALRTRVEVVTFARAIRAS